MQNLLSVYLGKTAILICKILNLGSGSTWPGHVALKLNKNFIKDVLSRSNTKVVIVAGTNGKTTTARLITCVIREENKSYLQNKAGANLINGLASTLIMGTNLNGKLEKDYLIFEADENALPRVIEETNPDYIVCLDLFRDQLDRYGEVDTIAKKWHKAFKKLNDKTTLILNADDPQIAFLSKNSKAKTSFFGLEEMEEKNEIEHGADSIYCPSCSNKLTFTVVFFSHLGIWNCSKCKLKRPKPNLDDIPSYPLRGTYNKYNVLSASLFGLKEGISLQKSQNAFKSFTPAFGRQEKLRYKNRDVQIFLSKNPISFNESLSTIRDLKGKNILILLNDRIPDGLDVSWIWDINFKENMEKETNIGVAGDRVYDMGLRLKYAGFFTHIIPDPGEALNQMTDKLESDETLYILPNYSAMLDIRKTITGKKIL